MLLLGVPLTVTVTLSLAVPFSPVQVMEYAVVALGLTFTLPEVAFGVVVMVSWFTTFVLNP